MSYLHASDLRLGMAFPHVAQRAEELREARWDALRAIMGVAVLEKVKGILLTGNTLADNRVSHKELMDLVALLGTSPCPVYLLPGLTDPLTPDSPYALRADLFQHPVQIVASGFTVDGITLGYGETPPPGQRVAMGGRPHAADQGPAHWSGPAEAYDYDQEVGHLSLIGESILRVPIGRYTWTTHPGDSPPETTLLKSDVPVAGRYFHLEAPETFVRPTFQHPLLQGMAAELDANPNAEAAVEAYGRLTDLVAGREDFS